MSSGPSKKVEILEKKELDRRIKDGKISPVHIPRFANFSEIIKFHFCTEIIKYKKENNLKQKDIAKIIDINKSEISKLFAYNLKEFSQERFLSFIEALLVHGAEIDMETAWDQIKNRAKNLEKNSIATNEYQ